MRFWLLISFLLAASAGALHAADKGKDPIPHCGGPFQLCGYVDEDSQAERIPRTFEIAGRFSEGLAAVRINGLYGYIDPTGKTVIASRFQAAGPFAGGYAEVRLENASGIIDRSGRLVVPMQFERIIPFANETFVAEPLRRGGPTAAVSEVRLERLSNGLYFLSPNAAGLYHLRKGWLTAQDLKFDIFDTPERGLIWAGKRNEHGDDEWGLLRSDGTWQVSPRYNHVQRLMETHAVVHSMPDYSLPPQQGREAVRWGAVDRDGKLVVPLKFAYLSYWRGGYGYASERAPYNSSGIADVSRKGFVRADGRLLANRYFDAIEAAEDGHLPRGRLGKTWYSIEANGRLMPDQLEGAPLAECPGGLSILRRGGGIEFRRPNGTPVGRFDDGFFDGRYCPGPFPVKRDGKWFFILQDGSVLGGKSGFEDISAFREGPLAVRVGGMWGIIDLAGKFTVEPHFARLRVDLNGTFAVGEGEGAYWINAAGERVGKPASERVDPKRALTCDGGLRFFQRADLWGLQNGKGETVIEPRFRALSCFSQGVSWATAPGEHGWCPIGLDGRRSEVLACRAIFYLMEWTDSRPEHFSDDPFENSVLWSRAWLDYQAGNREAEPKWISGR